MLFALSSGWSWRTHISSSKHVAILCLVLFSITDRLLCIVSSWWNNMNVCSSYQIESQDCLMWDLTRILRYAVWAGTDPLEKSRVSRKVTTVSCFPKFAFPGPQRRVLKQHRTHQLSELTSLCTFYNRYKSFLWAHLKCLWIELSNSVYKYRSKGNDSLCLISFSGNTVLKKVSWFGEVTDYLSKRWDGFKFHRICSTNSTEACSRKTLSHCQTPAFWNLKVNTHIK